jgi:hypothetical protein
MQGYEIWLFKADGAVSIIMEVRASDDAGAKVQAEAMLKEGIIRQGTRDFRSASNFARRSKSTQPSVVSFIF